MNGADKPNAATGDVTLFGCSRTKRSPLSSGSCAGSGLPLRDCVDPMGVNGQGGVRLVRRDEKISDR